jgi:hypothetical protein
MDNEGYPEKHELDKIVKWEGDNIIEIIDFIESLWYYDDSIKRKWHKDRFFGWCLRFELITMGWSGNESVINAMLRNFIFGTVWYAEWFRGGKHVFEIHPVNIGYRLVSEYCKENNISRQAIYQSKHLYKFIEISPKIRYIKKLN